MRFYALYLKTNLPLMLMTKCYHYQRTCET